MSRPYTTCGTNLNIQGPHSYKPRSHNIALRSRLYAHIFAFPLTTHKIALPISGLPNTNNIPTTKTHDIKHEYCLKFFFFVNFGVLYSNFFFPQVVIINCAFYYAQQLCVIFTFIKQMSKLHSSLDFYMKRCVLQHECHVNQNNKRRRNKVSIRRLKSIKCLFIKYLWPCPGGQGLQMQNYFTLDKEQTPYSHQ